MATILVVDDEYYVRELVCEVLLDDGYDVICVESGPQAVAAIQERPAHVALVDYMMPGMDGVQTIDALRRLRDGTMRFVCMSAAANLREIAEQTRSFGVLTKPFDINQISAIVERALAS